MARKQMEEQENQLFVPEHAAIKGDMSLSGGVRIEGVVHGNIVSSGGNLLFGPKSRVEGNVTGSDIATGGIITGNVLASEQLSVFSGAQVLGDVKAAAILVEKGGALKGQIVIGDIDLSAHSTDSSALAKKTADELVPSEQSDAE